MRGKGYFGGGGGGWGNISKNNTLRPVRPVRLTPGTSEC